MTYHYIHIVLPIALPRLRRQTGKKEKKEKKKPMITNPDTEEKKLQSSFYLM